MGVGKEREGEERNVDRLGLERKGVDGRKGECEGKVVAVRSQKPNVARTIREKVGTEKERKERRSGKGVGSQGLGSWNWEREWNRVGELGMVGKVGRCGKRGKVDTSNSMVVALSSQ